MEQYIPKSTLVAEIENKIEKYTKRGEESDAKRDGYGMYWGGVISCLNEVRTLCGTLEVKEVDLEKEIDKVWDTDYEDFGISAADFYRVTRYFFELGLKAQKGIEL